MKLITTLSEIAKHDPCEEGWLALLKLRNHPSCRVAHFKGDDTPFPVSEIGKLNNLGWLFWTSKLFSGNSVKPYIQAGLNAARKVRHFIKDERSIAALEATQDWIDGKITRDELINAVNKSSTCLANASASIYAARYMATIYAARAIGNVYVDGYMATICAARAAAVDAAEECGSQIEFQIKKLEILEEKFKNESLKDLTGLLYCE